MQTSLDKIMKIEITLQVKGIRCLKGLFTTFLRMLSATRQKAELYLVYFRQPKQIRFLLSSQQWNAVLAIDSRIVISDNSVINEKAEMLVIEFKQVISVLQIFCGLGEQQGPGEFILSLSKDKAIQGEEPFRSLNIVTNTDKIRSQIFKPLYDPPVIVNHAWLSGCASMQQKKVQFDIDTEHVMNILRVMHRDKQAQQEQRQMTLNLMFLQDKYVARLQTFLFMAEGLIFFSNFTSPKYEGSYFYTIQAKHLSKLYQLLLGKSTGSRLFIDNQNQIIFSYFHQGVYESQLATHEWLQFDRFEARQNKVAAKLEF